jgi:hypothetical protein
MITPLAMWMDSRIPTIQSHRRAGTGSSGSPWRLTISPSDLMITPPWLRMDARIPKVQPHPRPETGFRRSLFVGSPPVASDSRDHAAAVVDFVPGIGTEATLTVRPDAFAAVGFAAGRWSQPVAGTASVDPVKIIVVGDVTGFPDTDDPVTSSRVEASAEPRCAATRPFPAAVSRRSGRSVTE